jgi:hypothetical protein
MRGRSSSSGRSGPLEGKPPGRLILLESVLTPGNQPDFGRLLDLEMLALPGGRERTAGDFERCSRAPDSSSPP